MATLLDGDRLWDQIERLAKGSRSVVAVVGFVGRNPDRLFRWPRKATLVADLSDGRVREGVTSARGALKLARRGVEIRSYPSLHSKVLLFDRAAVVGSMNLSEESRGRLEEAGVLLRRPQELQAVRAYVERIRREARPENVDTLRELAKLEPRRKPVPSSARRSSRRRGVLVPEGRVWILPTEPDTDESREERKLARGYERRFREEHGVDRVIWYRACGQDVYRRVEEGDTLFFWWCRFRRSRGRLEGPYEAIRGVDLGKRLGGRRYRLAYFRRRGQKLLDERLYLGRLRALMRVVGDRRSPDEAADEPLRWKPRLLRKPERRRLARLLTRWAGAAGG